MTAGDLVGDANDDSRRAARRHRRGARPRARAADDHVRLRAEPSSTRFGLERRRPRGARGAARVPGRRARPGRAPAATSASRRAPTIRRSCSTRCATSRGSAAASSSCAGRSSASGARRPRAATQATPRNLMGFKDGTNNIKLEDEARLREHVWVGADDDPEWMRGGTYLVARRIRMLIEVWDRATPGRPGGDDRPREGRAARRSASATSSTRSTSTPSGADGAADHPGGRAHPPRERRRRRHHILRRGYSFTDGMDERLGQLDAGLFFISFQRDPRTQFVPLQRRLGENDALNEYIEAHRQRRLRRPARDPRGRLRRRDAARLSAVGFARADPGRRPRGVRAAAGRAGGRPRRAAGGRGARPARSRAASATPTCTRPRAPTRPGTRRPCSATRARASSSGRPGRDLGRAGRPRRDALLAPVPRVRPLPERPDEPLPRDPRAAEPGATSRTGRRASAGTASRSGTSWGRRRSPSTR